MIEVVEGTAAAARTAGAAALVVRVAPYTAAPDPGEATLGVAIADPALANAVITAMAAGIAAAAHAPFAPADPLDLPAAESGASSWTVPGIRTMHVRSRASLARRSGEAQGAIAIVRVTAGNARHLVALVDQLRAAGAAGIQLVWDGEAPPRARIERHVFAVLEHARATPAAAPVVLAGHAAPVAALHLLVARRAQLAALAVPIPSAPVAGAAAVAQLAPPASLAQLPAPAPAAQPSRKDDVR